MFGRPWPSWEQRPDITNFAEQIMTLTECSRRSAQLAIAAACKRGLIVQADGQYCLPA